MSKISSNIMDLVMPSNYSGEEKYPGAAAVHTGLPVLGVNIRLVKRSKGVKVILGSLEIGPYTRGTALNKSSIDNVIKSFVDGNFMNEKPKLESYVRYLLEKFLNVETTKTIPSAVMAPNRRSTAVNDDLLGYVHAILSSKDGRNHEVVGKQQGVVWENDYTKKTGGPEKYCAVLMKTYTRRLLLHKMEGVGVRSFDCKKDPNDLIDNSGIKPFCWFEKTYY